jgi:hypothetical protein
MIPGKSLETVVGLADGEDAGCRFHFRGSRARRLLAGPSAAFAGLIS